MTRSSQNSDGCLSHPSIPPLPASDEYQNIVNGDAHLEVRPILVHRQQGVR